MHGFDVYRCYLAMKLHFSNPKYDFFQYDGKVNAKEETYQQRNDFYFFETIARKYKKEEIPNYLLASFIQAEDATKVWIGDIKRDGRARYLAHQKQMDRLSYEVSQDCNTVVDYMERHNCTFNRLFETQQSNNSHPPLLKLYIKEAISLETLLIYDMILGFIPQWDRDLTDPLWERTSLKIRKFKPFLSINTDKYKEIIKEKFT